MGHEGRITRALWGPLNRTIISAGEDGTLRLWDVEVRIIDDKHASESVGALLTHPYPSGSSKQTGKQIAENRDHKKQINDLTFSNDLTHCITGSLDKTAKV